MPKKADFVSVEGGDYFVCICLCLYAEWCEMCDFH
jgi:hypothetical protein